MTAFPRWPWFVGLIVCLATCAADRAQADSPEEAERFFSAKVLPVLREHCFECHSHESGEANGKLMVDSLASMTVGGSRGAAIVAGDANRSLLYRAVLYTDNDLQMPPSEKIPDADIEAIRQWIAEGAAVPAAMRGDASLAMREADEHQAAAETHWAYQPLQSTFTTAGFGEQAVNPVDAALLENLKRFDLTYSAAASRETLIRRLSYDLTGLPPTRDETLRYVADPRETQVATSELIDRLLASPHFGERWARYWMDIARYADNKGYVFQEDREYPQAFKYRDWLVDAFNRDLPYDQFITQQLAADLVQGENADGENLPALGFLTLGRRFLNNKLDIIDDRLDVVARGLMGMTLTCARCHDHKFDPVTQADYYALAGVFLNTEEPGGDPWPHQLVDSKERRDSYILIRGSAGNRGAKVERRFVSFLAPDENPFTQGSGRLELAARIASPDNPLTARVMANRVWMHLMGTSLVESPSDFGLRCPTPLQSALLDRLATELIQGGWSLKHLIRTIVESTAYQQQSFHRDDGFAVDPANNLYWKMNLRRLDFEALRDTLLSRSGLLERSIHGKPEQIASPPFSHRRTVYSYIDRQNLPSVFRTFDLASPDSHSPGRAQTSVPQQGLYLLNSDFIAELSLHLGEQAEQVSSDPIQRVNWLFGQVFGRNPTSQENQLMTQFIETQSMDRELPPSNERWICGFGEFKPASGELVGFSRLPTFLGDRWQGGSQLPDASLGWCLLTAEGGHVGNDLKHAVVRRWVAPHAGTIQISGSLNHNADQGDGVRGTVLHGNQQLGQWTVKQSEVRTGVDSRQVQPGDTLDFVTDCISGPSHDSFGWKVRIRYTKGAREQYRSERELPQPLKQPLGPWAQLAGALLAANELAYID